MLFIDIISACGVMFGVFISGHFFLIKNNAASVALGIYVLSLSVLLSEPLIIDSRIPQKLIAMMLTISSFTAGPALFVYCKLRLQKSGIHVIHFFPAIFIFIAMLISPDATSEHQQSPDEAVIYGLFTLQLFTYTFLSIRLISQAKQERETMSARMAYLFVRMLTNASLALFSFSFLCTIFRFNHGEVFVTTIQVLVTIIIIIVALLNTEGLQKRPSREWTTNSH